MVRNNKIAFPPLESGTRRLCSRGTTPNYPVLASTGSLDSDNGGNTGELLTRTQKLAFSWIGIRESLSAVNLPLWRPSNLLLLSHRVAFFTHLCCYSYYTTNEPYFKPGRLHLSDWTDDRRRAPAPLFPLQTREPPVSIPKFLPIPPLPTVQK